MSAQMGFFDTVEVAKIPRVPTANPHPMTGQVMRPYQESAVSGAIEDLKSNRSSLVVMPTGSGKTKVMTEVARRFKGPRASRILVVAHRDELLQQAIDRFSRDTGFLVGLDQAQSFGHGERIVVASVQTISRKDRLERFSSDHFDLVMIDEAHHSPAASYRKVIDYFSSAKVLGVTATPDRADEKAMGQIFDSVAFLYEIEDAIRDGYLCDVVCSRIEIAGLDLSSVKTTAGDLNQGELDAVMKVEENLMAVADATMREAGDRKTLVFTTSVDNAHDKLDQVRMHLYPQRFHGLATELP